MLSSAAPVEGWICRNLHNIRGPSQREGCRFHGISKFICPMDGNTACLAKKEMFVQQGFYNGRQVSFLNSRSVPDLRLGEMRIATLRP